MKKTTFKKVISVILACTMIFSMFSICASAYDSDCDYPYNPLFLNDENLANNSLIAAIEAIPETVRNAYTILDISDNPLITDISGILESLPGLREIVANNCSINDLSCFSYFKTSNNSLVWLELDNNGIYDVTPLGELPYAIESLHLSENYITNIAPLFKVPSDENDTSANYTHLDLSDNYISDARLIEHFEYNSTGTYVFHMENNYITSDQYDDLSTTYYEFGEQYDIPNNESERFVIGEIKYIDDNDNVVTTYGVKGYYGGIVDTDITIPTCGVVTRHDNSGASVQIKAIDFRAFKDNVVLEVIHMNNNILDIGAEAFKSCGNLRRIKLSSAITNIKELTFDHCVELAGVSIPNNVMNIETNAFRKCVRLKAAEFSNPLTELHELAFHYCEPEIFEVYISSSISDEELSSEDANLLDDVYGLKLTGFETTENPFDSIRRDFNIVNGLMSGTTYSGDALKVPAGVDTINVSSYTTPDALESVIIPEGVTSINLPIDISSRDLKVLLPSTISTIGTFIISSVPSNVDIYYKSTNTVASSYVTSHNFVGITDYEISYDVLDNYVGTPVVGTEIAIPSKLGFDVIGDHSFWYQNNNYVDNISKITLPNGIREIRTNAFRHCSNMTEFVFGNDNMLKTIGVGAFSKCYALQTISLPTSITTIPALAFYYCSNLRSFAVHNGVTTIGNNAFEGCIRMTTISIPNSVESIGARAFLNDERLVTFAISPDASLSYIGLNIFEGCEKLVNTGGTDTTLFRLPEAINYIPAHAFKHCGSLINLRLPDNMTEVYQFASNALEGTNIETLTISCVDTPRTNDLANWLRSKGYSVISRYLEETTYFMTSNYRTNTILVNNTILDVNSNIDLIDNVVFDYMCNRAENDICIEDLEYLIDIVLIRNS